jgi:hypothetical protein
MSGFNSSAPDLPAAAEPLGLTVHSSPRLPALDEPARRTRLGRLKMMLVLLVCAAPVIGSYLAYYLLRPPARSNYATLIEPTRTLPALQARTLDGAPADAQALRGQWLLVVIGPAECSGDCERRLYLQRQLREMLGRDRDRLDKVWFVDDRAAVPAALREALGADPALHVLRVPPDALAAWLAPAPGQALEDHLYVVDPMGEWMMRAPADADPARLKRDLERLLRASASWDRAGRD